MLEVLDLKVSYGAIEALKGVSLSVKPGDITCIIGANGAGKSTLLKTISGLAGRRSGEIRYEGRPVPQAAHKVTAMGIVHVPEGRRVFANMTVEENLLMGAYLRRDPLRESLDSVYSLFPVLNERRGQFAGTLSGGEQQMLAVGRGLMAQPRLLMLDEPSLGLAPKAIDTLFEAILRIHSRGVPILLVEQNAYQALSVSQKAYVLETGKMVQEGTGKELLSDPHVMEYYLGRKQRAEGGGPS